MNLKDELTSLYNSLLEKNEVEGLAFLAERFAGEIVFSTSFGLEDQVITHLILDNLSIIQSKMSEHLTLYSISPSCERITIRH